MSTFFILFLIDFLNKTDIFIFFSPNKCSFLPKHSLSFSRAITSATRDLHSSEMGASPPLLQPNTLPVKNCTFSLCVSPKLQVQVPADRAMGWG